MAHKGYHNAEGRRIPGVTTITGRYGDKGALLWWANQVGLGEHESCDFQPVCPKCNRRKGLTQQEASRPAATMGTLAHDLIEQHIFHADGKEYTIDQSEFAHLSDDEYATSEQCAESFKTWFKNYDVQIVSTELGLVSEEYQFGGRLDATAMIGGKFVLLDWKTSKGIFESYISQLAGYVILLEENGQPQVQELHILRVSKDTGGFEHRMWPREKVQIAIDHFIHCRKLYEMDKKLKALLK